MTSKELSIQSINNFSDQELYNLLFGPAEELKQATLACDEEFVVAVYGATIIPMQRRIDALLKLNKSKNINNIILSGGIGWLGIDSTKNTLAELKAKFNDQKYFSMLNRRTKMILEALPDFKNKILFDLFGVDFDGLSHEEVTSIILSSMYENSNLNDYIMYEYNKCNSKSFNVWLNENIDHLIQQYLITFVCESEVMQFDLLSKFEGKSNIILESASFNTLDNAKNTLIEFKKIQEKRNIKTLVIINEWPYLHRAVLTTKKIAKDLNIDVNILGYPASYSENIEWYYSTMDEFRNNKIRGTIENLKKEVIYNDCEPFEVDRYLKEDYMNENLPQIVICQNEYLKFNKKKSY